jgi:hypothetical protein
VLHSDVGGDLALKSFDFRTQDEILRFEDTGNCGVDLSLNLPILRAEIEKRKLQGEPRWQSLRTEKYS